MMTYTGAPWMITIVISVMLVLTLAGFASISRKPARLENQSSPAGRWVITGLLGLVLVEVVLLFIVTVFLF
jgi:hypothetical protein